MVWSERIVCALWASSFVRREDKIGLGDKEFVERSEYLAVIFISHAREPR